MLVKSIVCCINNCQWVTLFQIRPSIIRGFRSTLDLSRLNPKDKLMLEFDIILSLLLIISQQIGLNKTLLNTWFQIH